MAWTPEELEAIRKADAEIEQEFDQCGEVVGGMSLREAQRLDRAAYLETLDPEERLKCEANAQACAKYKATHPDRFKEYNAKYYQENKERMIEANRRWRAAHREYVNAQERERARRRRRQQKQFRQEEGDPK